MTTTVSNTQEVVDDEVLADDVYADENNSRATSSLRTGPLVALWVVIAIVILGIVLYVIEPMFQERDQGLLLDRYRTSIDKAANQATGLQGVEVSTTAPAIGSAIGILEVGSLGVQTVAVEGADSATTRVGPGHVPGTAAPGQPGNAVIVGRRTMFGGPFGDLSSMQIGDEIVVTTTQGQTLYQVTDVGAAELTSEATPSSAPVVAAPTTTSTTTTVAPAEAAAPADAPVVTATLEAASADAAAESTTTTTIAAVESSLDGGRIPLNSLYGASKDDRLTLVSSASAFPWNSAQAAVVIAVMVGKPFAPTPQNGRTAGQIGNVGDTSSWPVVLLAFLFLAAAVAGAVLLYRRSSPRVAYLLTVPPLVVFAILAAESFSRLLPAWS
ncbi:MAG: sortase [Actinobacteria bacterium]|nr:sortase [Actinomycetota bacterium]MSY25050.1 sortase [Actinomycetota bacterium]MSY34101.1 sortase [Actinomycetota bacterium]MSZ51593.1 sortase [Actinomycetota bacterium]MTA42241.1 sortase [Actinomycetota bacterium]